MVIRAELTPTGGERETGGVVDVRGPVEHAAGPQEEEYHGRQDVVGGQRRGPDLRLSVSTT